MIKTIFNVIAVIIFVLSIISCDKIKSVPGSANIKAEIVEYGVYKQITERVIKKNSDTTSGYTSRPKSKNGVVFVRETENIKVIKGTIFGYKVKLYGLSVGERTPIDVMYQHPPIVGHDGKVSTGFTLKKSPRSSNGEFEGGIFYRLSEDYELVPGKWTLSVLHKDRVLAEKTFNLVE